MKYQQIVALASAIALGASAHPHVLRDMDIKVCSTAITSVGLSWRNC